MTSLELQTSADGRAPGLVRAELKRWLEARAWPAEDREDLEFAVSEAVSNAAEHAYRPDASPKDPEPVVAVRVMELIDPGGRRVKVVVDDVGVWRCPPPSQEYRGRGLRMIDALMESCEVNRSSAGTRVTMISRPVEPQPQGPQAFRSTEAAEPARPWLSGCAGLRSSPTPDWHS